MKVVSDKISALFEVQQKESKRESERTSALFKEQIEKGSERTSARLKEHQESNVKEMKKLGDEIKTRLDNSLENHRKELHQEVKAQIGDVHKRIAVVDTSVKNVIEDLHQARQEQGDEIQKVTNAQRKFES